MGHAGLPLHRVPRVYGNPPLAHPRPAWDDLIAAFHNDGILPNDTWREVQQKTHGRDYRRCVRARLLEIRDPLRQRWGDLWLRDIRPWSPPYDLPNTCHLCGKCDTVSSAATTGANRCAHCSQVTVCPWPETSRGPAQAHGGEGIAPAHRVSTRPLTRARGPRGRRPSVDPRAPAGPHVRCAPVAGVRALTPTCRHTLQNPQHHAFADGGTGRGTSGPAAERRRRPSGA